MKTRIIIALVAAAAVIGGTVLVGGARNTTPEPPRTWEMTGTAEPGTAPDGSDSKGPTPSDTGRIEETVRSFLAGYGTQRWDDPGPGSWTAAAAAFCTPEFGRQLQERHSSGGQAWTEFVQKRWIRRVDLTSVDVRPPTASDASRATAVVAYQLLTAVDGGPVLSSQLITKSLALERQSGQWKVAGISDLVSGYAPPIQEPRTPEPAPTVQG
jgi:hypothetical protein